MNTPLISILIPFKNTAEYLTECLNSIRDQTYTHWEVLAVDDHSQDTSLKLVQGIAENDRRIRVLINTGTGIIEALRTAYASSTGELITRMDSDDLMRPQRLKTMVNALSNSGTGHLAVGGVRYFSHRGISNGYARYEAWLNQLTETGRNFSEIYKECVIPSPCWMAYRQDLDNCGAFEPDRYPEDYDLCFRFYESDLKCIPCSEVLHLWRDYDARTSRTSEHYAHNYFLDIKLHYFLKLEYDPKRPLVVWGAGTKGKTIAKGLNAKQIAFHWLCDNPNKIGKSIYGNEMLHYRFLEELRNPQSIITVANEDDQKAIRAYLRAFGHEAMRDYYFFC